MTFSQPILCIEEIAAFPEEANVKATLDNQEQQVDDLSAQVAGDAYALNEDAMANTADTVAQNLGKQQYVQETAKRAFRGANSAIDDVVNRQVGIFR